MPSFHWSPGIGDPTFIGWLTVVLYLAACLSCWKSGRKVATDDRRGGDEPRAWGFITILFLALGINKQLDLQTALTEAGRAAAQLQGWYPQRRSVQAVFIAVVAITLVMAAITLLVWVRRAPAPTWLVLTGTTMVLAYVVIRAAYFHRVDRFIGTSILDPSWHWIVEVCGLCLVLIGSHWRQVRRSHATLIPRHGLGE